MVTEEEPAVDLAAWFKNIIEQHEDATEALEVIHRTLIARNLLSRTVLHKYQCKRGCQIATVFRAGGPILCAVRDYKMSRGLNDFTSVAKARAKNTIDGERWWPSHVYDVEQLESFSTPENQAGMTMACPHFHDTVLASRVLADAADVRPGHPSKPTRF